MFKTTLVGFGLFTLTLSLYGKERYFDDVLPGEHAPYVEEESPLALGEPRALVDVEGLERTQLIRELRERAVNVRPFQALVEVELPSLMMDEEFEGGTEAFVVRSYGPGEWSVQHRRDPRTYVDQSGNELRFGTGWDLGAWLSRGPADGGGALTLPAWMIDEAYLVGLDAKSGEAQFDFTLESQPSARVEAQVDLTTGLLAGLSLSFFEEVDRYGVQVFDIMVDVKEVTFDVAEDFVAGRPGEGGASYAETPALRVGVVPGA